MKLNRRRIMGLTIFAIMIPGFFAIAFMPSTVEGVYSPLAISSTMGCDCDQYEEIRDGRMLFHVDDGKEAWIHGVYKTGASGMVEFSYKGMPLMRAEPHLLGTRFFYIETGTSEWRWKRFITKRMRDHMAGVVSREFVFEPEGMRITTYDHQFKVIDTSFRPKKSGTPPLGE